MTFPTPNLDNRTFDDLLQEAIDIVRKSDSDWTDLTPSDPGVVLLEAFSHLTELMIHRINQLPEKVYVALLELLDVQPLPPCAASVEVDFTLEIPRRDTLYIPPGTVITTPGSSDGSLPSRFETLIGGTFEAEQTTLSLPAGHCKSYAGERVGRSSGTAGQHFTVANAPIIAPNFVGADLMVGVETDQKDIPPGALSIEHDGKAFAIWTEVARFTPGTAGKPVYTVNRHQGEIRFAPSLRTTETDGALENRPVDLGTRPDTGAEIRVWYRGLSEGHGNVRPTLLSVLDDPIEGLSVSNPKGATGGRAAESLENAMKRGPMSLHSLERAITARDYEEIAKQASGSVNRAHAAADAALWAHGIRGAVNVTLVPQPTEVQGAITAQTLNEATSDITLLQVKTILDQRRALGTSAIVSWARYKTIHVRADIKVFPEQDPKSTQARLNDRLNDMISPVDLGGDHTGWDFGRPILSWDVLRAISDQPGVAKVSNVRLVVDKSPAVDANSLARDAYQADTWFTASGENVFRSGNNCESWEAVAEFPGEEVTLVSTYNSDAGDDPSRAGLVCAICREGDTSRLYVSHDCGNHFALIGTFEMEVTDVAWIFRDWLPSLFLASPSGLFEILLRPDAAPIQIIIDPGHPEMGATSVVISADQQGHIQVAVAGTGESGIYLSTKAGLTDSFDFIGLSGELIRILMVQHTQTQRYLWAGVSAIGEQPGNGVYRLRLTPSGADQDDWENFAEGWSAGSCRDLANDGKTIYAGSFRRGVLSLDPEADAPTWRNPPVGCGLPLRDVSRLKPVSALAAQDGLVLAGGPDGIYRTEDEGVNYRCCSDPVFENEMKLPSTWVYRSGTHELNVTHNDEPD
jgi:hypothetical protein